MPRIHPRSSRPNAPASTEPSLVLQGQRDRADAGLSTLQARAGIDVGLPVPRRDQAWPAFGHVAGRGGRSRSRGCDPPVPATLSQDGNSLIVSQGRTEHL